MPSRPIARSPRFERSRSPSESSDRHDIIMAALTLDPGRCRARSPDRQGFIPRGRDYAACWFRLRTVEYPVERDFARGVAPGRGQPRAVPRTPARGRKRARSLATARVDWATLLRRTFDVDGLLLQGRAARAPRDSRRSGREGGRLDRTYGKLRTGRSWLDGRWALRIVSSHRDARHAGRRLV